MKILATRRCRTCGVVKPLSEYQERVGITANPRESHLLTCIDCNRNRLRRGQNQYTVERLPRGFWVREDEPERGPLSRGELKSRLLQRARSTPGREGA